MKEIDLFYTATWSTSVEVPDDFEVTPESIEALNVANRADFDFQDGGADWNFDPVDSYMNALEEFPPCSE